MKLLGETHHPDVFSIAAAVAHCAIVERLRTIDTCNGARCTLASAMLCGGLFLVSRVPLAERIAPRWSA